MTATVHGPYEHTGAYRPDILAQLEGTEPQWSDAPAECESPEPDLSGKPLPSLRDFARAIADQIAADAYAEAGYRSHAAAALGYAAAMISWDCRDVRPLCDDVSVYTQLLRDQEFRDARAAWDNLRSIRALQLGGWDALRAANQVRS